MARLEGLVSLRGNSVQATQFRLKLSYFGLCTQTQNLSLLLSVCVTLKEVPELV
jgi:hypothetical protein